MPSAQSQREGYRSKRQRARSGSSTRSFAGRVATPPLFLESNFPPSGSTRMMERTTSSLTIHFFVRDKLTIFDIMKTINVREAESAFLSVRLALYVSGSKMMHDNHIMSSDSCTNHPLQAFHPTQRYHKSQSTPSTCWTILLQVSVFCRRLHVLLTSESDWMNAKSKSSRDCTYIPIAG
jgi:hypothetical protein